MSNPRHRFGYTMGSLPLHDEVTAIESLSGMGYRSIVLVPRLTTLDLDADWFGECAAEITRRMDRHGLQPILNLNGHFMGNPMDWAWPSLSSDEDEVADVSMMLACRWIEVASDFSTPQDDIKVVLSSGAARVGQETSPIGDTETRLERLSERLNRVLACGCKNNVQILFRPACGHFISTIAQYERLLQWLDHPDELGLAAEVDAMIQAGEFPLLDRLQRNLRRLSVVFIEDRHLPTEIRMTEDWAFDGMRFLNALLGTAFNGTVVVRGTARPSGTRDLACPVPGLEQAGAAMDAIRKQVKFDVGEAY